ncbi:MAG: DUF2262 domain-containing protein [Myxococcales bacterium]
MTRLIFPILASCLLWPTAAAAAESKPSANETQVIRGFVAPDGVADGAVPGDRDGEWLTSLTLSPWQFERGPAHKTGAMLWHLCRTEKELQTAFATLPKAGVFVEARVARPATLTKSLGRPVGEDEYLLVSVKPVPADPTLALLAKQMAPPSQISSPFLGTLTLEPRFGWYTGKRALPSGETYEVYVGKGGAGALPAAEKAVRRFEATLAEVRAAVAAQLIGTYNDSWGEGAAITAAQLAARIRLESFHWNGPDAGGGTVWFGDGGLFLGHSIEVFLDAAGKVESASLAG